jgi:hydrogenase maturation factor
MCTNSILQVKKLTGSLAIMSDGRKVHLGPTHFISVGDYLEVYADLAIEKVSDSDARTIQEARLKRKLL